MPPAAKKKSKSTKSAAKAGTGKEMRSVSKRATCIREVANWASIKPHHRFDSKSFKPQRMLQDMPSASPKMRALLDKIEELDARDAREHGLHYKHFIFSDLRTMGYGAKVVAGALLASGWTLAFSDRMRLKDDEELLKTRGRNFGLLSSTAIYGTGVTHKLRGQQIKRFNVRPDNVHGDVMRIMVLDSGFKEGIDLFDVKYVHLFEPQTTRADERQAVGRGTRVCGQKGLKFEPKQGWPLHVYTYDVVDGKGVSLHEQYLAASGMNTDLLSFAAELEEKTMLGAVDAELTRPVHEFTVVEDPKDAAPKLAYPALSEDKDRDAMSGGRLGGAGFGTGSVVSVQQQNRQRSQPRSQPQPKVLCAGYCGQRPTKDVPAKVGQLMAAYLSLGRGDAARRVRARSTLCSKLMDDVAYCSRMQVIMQHPEMFKAKYGTTVAEGVRRLILPTHRELKRVAVHVAPYMTKDVAAQLLADIDVQDHEHEELLNQPSNPPPVIDLDSTPKAKRVDHVDLITPPRKQIQKKVEHVDLTSASSERLRRSVHGSNRIKSRRAPEVIDLRSQSSSVNQRSQPRRSPEIIDLRSQSSVNQRSKPRRAPEVYDLRSQSSVNQRARRIPEVIDLRSQSSVVNQRSQLQRSPEVIDLRSRSSSVNQRFRRGEVIDLRSRSSSMNQKISPRRSPEVIDLRTPTPVIASTPYDDATSHFQHPPIPTGGFAAVRRYVRQNLMYLKWEVTGLKNECRDGAASSDTAFFSASSAADRSTPYFSATSTSASRSTYRTASKSIPPFKVGGAGEKSRSGSGAKRGIVAKMTASQQFMREWLTPASPLKGMLAFWSVGTGKTGNAIGVASANFEPAGYTIVWVTRNTLREDLYKNMFELVFHEGLRQRLLGRSRDGRSERFRMPRERADQMRLLSKAWSIRPLSYKQFSNTLSGRNEAYATLVARNGAADPLRKTLIIIDEAHKLFTNDDLRGNEKIDVDLLQRMLHKSYEVSGADSAKVLLMTGTPYGADPMDMVRLLNLLRPREDQLPVDFQAFKARFLDVDGKFTEAGKMKYWDAIAGYVSYLNREKDARSFAQPQFHKVTVSLGEKSDLQGKMEQLNAEAGQLDQQHEDAKARAAARCGKSARDEDARCRQEKAVAQAEAKELRKRLGDIRKQLTKAKNGMKGDNSSQAAALRQRCSRK